MEFKPPDNIFWLFSTSAQAIAAFVGFLTAGYYFVLQTMEMRLSKDNSLEEIYAEIKSRHYLILIILLILTGLAIIGSMIMVYLNGYNFPINPYLIIIVSIINFSTIVIAIIFVISIVNPDKYRNATNKLIQDDKFIKTSETPSTIKIEDFLKQFIQIEKLLPKIVEKYNISYPISYQSKNYIGPKQTMEILKRRDLIEPNLFNKFLEVNKVRNLAVHGKVDYVGNNIYEMLKDILIKLNDMNDLADTIDSM